jgi:hypothetical protein
MCRIVFQNSNMILNSSLNGLGCTAKGTRDIEHFPFEEN